MTAFRQVQITFPNSLELQGDVTSRLDTLISNIDSALVASSSRNQSVEGLLNQELVSVFYQNVNNWPVTTIGDKCDYKNGKAHEQLETKDGEYRLVTSKFVSTQGVSSRRVSKALTPLHDGDVAFVLSDLPNGKALAKAYLVESEKDLTLNQRVLRIKSPEFDPLFLYFQVNRHPYLLSFDNGESQTHLKLAQVLSCPLVIPDLDIQRSVGKKFLELKKLGSESELLAQSKSEKLEDLKKSLLFQFLDPQYLEDLVA
jgi:type I restriction enzyme S subunit